MGRPRLYTEPRISTGLRLTESMHTEMANAAHDRDLPMNRLIEVALRDFLDRLIPVSELKLTRDL